MNNSSLVAFLKDLVRIPSMNGDEEKVLQRVKAEMEDLGYPKIWFDELGNLYGKIGDGPNIIAIDGHLDTVDVGNLSNWEHPPFEAHESEGRIYGRGACDQKGGIAAAIYAGKELIDRGIPQDTSLVVCATVLEEDYEGVSWKFILEETEFRPSVVLLTEPTNMEIKIGQRGRMEMKVNLEGISSHGSAPERGDNAIYKAAPILKEIDELNKNYESDSKLGAASITATDIRSSAPSLCAVADSCTIHLDRRLTSGETLQSCKREIESLESVKSSQGTVSIPEYQVRSYTGKEIKLPAYYPAWIMEEDHIAVKRAKTAFKEAYKSDPEIGVWAFSTNGVWTKGVHDIPTIGFGPGNEEYAHSPKEHIEIEQLNQSVKFFVEFVRDSKQS